MKKKKYLWLLLLLLVILLIVTLYFLYRSTTERKPFYKIESRVDTLEKKQKEEPQDVLGWLKVQGTSIDYPVLYSNTLDLFGTDYDYIWSNEKTEQLTRRTLLFGHNILNVSSHPLINHPKHRRFEQLLGFIYSDYAKENKYIQYTIDGKDYLFKIYSIAFVTRDLTRYKELDSSSEIEAYIKRAKEESYFDFDLDVNQNDRLITLVTCTRFFGNNTNYEFKIEGRLLREKEKIDNYDLKEKKNYQGIKKILKEGETDETTA